MRLTRLAGIVTPDRALRLAFTGPRGERFEVNILEEHLVRVWHRPEGRPRLDRTWSVVGPNGDVPREGHVLQRYLVSGIATTGLKG